MAFDWSSLFDEVARETPAEQDDLAALATDLDRPLSDEEIDEAGEDGASEWTIPSGPLPASYLDLLGWSNGGSLIRDDVSLDPFFSTHEVRDYLLSYLVPKWMPGALPFGFDGGGAFYMFDMRQPAENGHYPVIRVDSGDLDWDEAEVMAASFDEWLRNRG